MLGGRPPRLIADSILDGKQYAALARMVGRYPAFPRVAKRYLVGGGRYPYACRVRTPIGMVTATAYSHHDIFTIQEVFGREDYRADSTIGTVVDIGSNVGLSVLYFLTRNSTSRCYAYEPVPRNISRLRSNLAQYEARYELHEVAVAASGGLVDFTVEPTGRYGGIGVTGSDHVRVTCRSVADVLATVLEQEERIDILKIDTEGAELATVRAIPRHQLARIRTVYYETRTPFNPDPGRFEMQFACETCRLVERNPHERD